MILKPQRVMTGMFAAALAAAIPAAPASTPNAAGGQAQMVITVQPAHPGGSVPGSLDPSELTVLQRNTRVPVLSVKRLSGSLAGMQLFVFLDDSARSTSLGVQLSELKAFLRSLPDTMQVGIGYMRSGGAKVVQPFTYDRQKAADALRLPEAMPGENGSPYFALSDLVKHWPSKEPTGRRVALLFTDGVDRYNQDQTIMDDPYADVAAADALKNGVTVYSVYLRDAGRYDRGAWVTNMAQSRLLKLCEETGGHAYEDYLFDPVEIWPYLNDFRARLDNQYTVTFQALNQRGVEPVKLRTELPGLKIECPSRVYVP
jgi:hypothetical protein